MKHTESLLTRSIEKYITVESVLIALVIVILSLSIYQVFLKERVVMPAAYNAWVKQTGNEKNLTYDEWRAMMSSMEDNNQSVIIFSK